MDYALNYPLIELPLYRAALAASSPPLNSFVVKTDDGVYMLLANPWRHFGLEQLTQTGAACREKAESSDPTSFQIEEKNFPVLVVDNTAAASLWSQQIRQLRDMLGLPITALVETLRVTRPALYDWLRGEQPNRSNQQRIRTLLEVADAWNRLGVGPMSRYWNIPAPAGGADVRSTLMSPNLSLQDFNAVIAKLGIGKRLLPPRTSKPRLVDRSSRDPKNRHRRKAWGTTSSNAE